jgi:molybdopterin converting factor subunit 1
MVTVLFFGPLAEITGCTKLQVADTQDTESLILKIKEQYPALATCKFALAVNKTVVQENTVLATGNEIAFLPPFSGG